MCEIQWIDAGGNPTPDTRPAIGRVRTRERYEQHHGRALHFPASRWFAICAEHAKQMDGPGMDIWEWEDAR